MRNTKTILAFLAAVLVLAGTSLSQTRAGEQKAIVVVFNDGHRQNIPVENISRIEFNAGAVLVFKDGHQQKVPLADIASMEFNSPAKESPLGKNYFVGRWKVGVGAGGGTFFITLEADGEAHKSLGAGHGTWAFVNGEAHISWDDGWHDAIRKVGSKHEKLAYEPGKTFSDPPSNVTDARNLTAQPI
ncbi:MAG TPA: hypothetical protein VJO35_13995 [Terriglobales bacterium]|nr:hypothetical protein [Terriglobales bacterium]